MTFADSVAGVHEAPTSQDADGAVSTDVAELGSVAEPSENCVAVVLWGDRTQLGIAVPKLAGLLSATQAGS